MGETWDKLTSEVRKTFTSQWSLRTGKKVPGISDLLLGSNDGVQFNGTVLYADLAESTNLVDNHDPTFAAAIYKAYLFCSAEAIKSVGGEIVSYDGDRIMSIFIGEDQANAAVFAALRIAGAAERLIGRMLEAHYSDKKFYLQHGVGIDSSPILAARTGVRGDNDIVWVGRAANYAAKLSSLRIHRYPIVITGDVLMNLTGEAVRSRDQQLMWTNMYRKLNTCQLYGTEWLHYNF